MFEFPVNSGDPGPKVVMNGVAYFAATGVSTGRELWCSNGTAVGTWRVRDIAPGQHGSFPAELTVIGSALYFRALDGVTDNLWRSDGTEAGTTRVTSGINAISGLVVQGQRLFFVATDPSNGAQIWRTEGTPASTIRLTSIAGLNPAFLTRLGNNNLLFSGTSGGLGQETAPPATAASCGEPTVRRPAPGCSPTWCPVPWTVRLPAWPGSTTGYTFGARIRA